MKRFAVLFLLLILSLSFCACGSGENGTIESIDNNKLNEVGGVTESVTETIATPAREYPQNFLAAFEDGTTVFGLSDIGRFDIESITFLDTLKDMPAGAWDASADKDGSVMAWMNGVDVFVAGEGGVTATSCKNLFSGYECVKSINFNDCFYTDIAVSMDEMFNLNYNLTELDLSFFNTSNVTNMEGMFWSCYSLKNCDLTSFDTSNVTNMNAMFKNCRSLETVDLSTFDTTKTTTMSSMFKECRSLKELDVSNFNTSAVTDMNEMFNDCYSLTTLDVTNFDTSNVTSMFSMFYHLGLETLDVSSFDTSKVKNMRLMFAESDNLKNLDLSGFDFSSVTETTEMFKNCGNLTSVGCTISLPDGCKQKGMYMGSGME